MDLGAFLSGLIELSVSGLLALVVSYLSFRIYPRLMGFDAVDELKRGNLAVGMILAGMVGSTTLVLREALLPAGAGFQIVFFRGATSLNLFQAAGLSLGYVAVAMILAFLMVWATTKLFLVLTRDLDEVAEITKGNLAVALCLTGILLSMSLLLARGVRALFEAHPGIH